MRTKILVTGGTGYIGSIACVALIEAGFRPIIIDNLYNSRIEVLSGIEKITNQRPIFIEGDLRDTIMLNQVFENHDISAVFHFASLKSIGESITRPLKYFDNNLKGTIALISAMSIANVKTLVFSSSAAVYGEPASVPIDENFPLSATTPYGRIKVITEEILNDIANSDCTWRIACLRYFNPVGAHPSGLIGEYSIGAQINLVPNIVHVAIGKHRLLSIFGGDYSTPDGTGIRDYIHVMDLAKGQLAALRYIENNSGLISVNLGTGIGISVLELVGAFERVSGRTIPYAIMPRRPGDVASCYASPANAKSLFGWSAQRSIDEMCEDTWNWQSKNPFG